MIFCQQVNNIIMLLHKKFEQNPIHGSREKPKMVVGDGGSFLKNVNHFDLKLNKFVHLTLMHLP
jgi:hypothetical protein